VATAHGTRALWSIAVALVWVVGLPGPGAEDVARAHGTAPSVGLHSSLRVPALGADFEGNEDVKVDDDESVLPDVASVRSVPPEVESQTRPWDVVDCQVVTVPVAETHLRAWCQAPATFACPQGTTAVTAYKFRTRPRDGTGADWSGWQLLNGPCTPTVEPGADDLDAAVARELKRLKIPAKRAEIAPVTTWFAVQTPMTLYTDARLERMTVQVLGREVELELRPRQFTWDPGDGSEPIVTTEPGGPYPDQTTTHTYRKVGEYRVTLTTSWSGRFRVVGEDAWRPVAGTGETVHRTAPFVTREIRSVLS